MRHELNDMQSVQSDETDIREATPTDPIVDMPPPASLVDSLRSALASGFCHLYHLVGGLELSGL